MKYILILTATALAIFGAISYQDRSHKIDRGYCFSESRYVSSAEFQTKAVNHLYEYWPRHTLPPLKSSITKDEFVIELLKPENCCYGPFKPDSGETFDRSRNSLASHQGFTYLISFKVPESVTTVYKNSSVTIATDQCARRFMNWKSVL